MSFRTTYAICALGCSLFALSACEKKADPPPVASAIAPIVTSTAPPAVTTLAPPSTTAAAVEDDEPVEDDYEDEGKEINANTVETELNAIEKQLK